MIKSTTRQSLEYYLKVAETGSIRAAAEQLRIAPSAVSRKVAQLEHEFGLELIIRHARGVKLTEAGRLVHAYLLESKRRDALLYETVSELRGLKRGSVSIATGSGFVHGLVAAALVGFFARYPMIQVEIATSTADEILKVVLEDEADIGIVFGPVDDPGIRVVRELEQPLRLIVAPSHALAGCNAVTLADLVEVPLALPPVTAGIRQVVDRAFRSKGLKVAPVLTVGPVQGLIQFAAAGAGATFLPEFSCNDELVAGRLSAVPLEEDAILYTRAGLFVRRDRHLTPSADALLRHLEASFPFRN